MEAFLGLLAIFAGGVIVLTLMEVSADKFSTWRRRQPVLLANEEYGHNHAMRYCLLLRSTRFDLEASDTNPWEKARIHDNALGGPLNFRAHLNASMAPIIVKTIKNAETMRETVAINYPNATWQEDILSDMRQARFILIAPHWPSPSLEWEIQTIVREDLLSRTFILAPDFRCFGTSPRQRSAADVRFGAYTGSFEIDPGLESTLPPDFRAKLPELVLRVKAQHAELSALRLEAEAELPIKEFKKAYGRFGYKDAYKDALGSAMEWLAREHECKDGWAQAKSAFRALGLTLPDPARSGQVLWYYEGPQAPKVVSDWISVRGWDLERLANTNTTKPIRAGAA